MEFERDEEFSHKIRNENFDSKAPTTAEDVGPAMEPEFAEKTGSLPPLNSSMERFVNHMNSKSLYLGSFKESDKAAVDLGDQTNDFESYFVRSRATSSAAASTHVLDTHFSKEETEDILVNYDGSVKPRLEKMPSAERIVMVDYAERESMDGRSSISRFDTNSLSAQFEEQNLKGEKLRIVDDTATTTAENLINWEGVSFEDAEFLTDLESSTISRAKIKIIPNSCTIESVEERFLRMPFEFFKALCHEDVVKERKVKPRKLNSEIMSSIYILYSKGLFEQLVIRIIREDFKRVQSPFELFRANTDEARVITGICRSLGSDIFKKILKPEVDWIIEQGDSLDILYQNIQCSSVEIIETLAPISTRIISGVFRSIMNQPINLGSPSFSLRMFLLGRIIQLAFKEAKDQFPETKFEASVITLLFLRLVCPAIINPLDYQITDCPPRISIRQNLIGLAKFVQTMAGRCFLKECPEDFQSTHSKTLLSSWKYVSDIFHNDFINFCFRTQLIASTCCDFRCPLPNGISRNHCNSALMLFLEEILDNISCLKILSPKHGIMIKSSDHLIKSDKREVLISTIHGLLLYYRLNSFELSGVVDLLLNRKKIVTLRNSEKAIAFYGDGKYVRSWRFMKSKQVYVNGKHSRMVFRADNTLESEKAVADWFNVIDRVQRMF